MSRHRIICTVHRCKIAARDQQRFGCNCNHLVCLRWGDSHRHNGGSRCRETRAVRKAVPLRPPLHTDVVNSGGLRMMGHDQCAVGRYNQCFGVDRDNFKPSRRSQINQAVVTKDCRCQHGHRVPLVLHECLNRWLHHDRHCCSTRVRCRLDVNRAKFGDNVYLYANNPEQIFQSCVCYINWCGG